MAQDIDVVMLLCDAAETANGKLYVLGGGWSQVLIPDTPLSMALAVKMAIPWDQANTRFTVDVRLVNEDGEAVHTPDDEPIGAQGQIEVGRPPGLKPGEALDAPFVLSFTNITLPPGGYVWELAVSPPSDYVAARAAFRVRSAPGT
jgi:hypothetical protein